MARMSLWSSAPPTAASTSFPSWPEELVRLEVDVILASAGPAALAAREATTSVPVVFVGVVDPVGLGLVPSLGRPGGNLTGLATTSEDFAGKRLELLKAVVPSLKRAAVLWHPSNLTNPIQLKGAQVAARTLGVRLEPVPIEGPNDFDAAGKAVRGTDGLLFLESPLFTTHRARLAELASKSRLARENTSRSEASCRTARSFTTSTGVPPSTWTRSSRAPNPPICRWSSPPSSSSSSTSRLPRPSRRPSRRRYWRGRMR